MKNTCRLYSDLAWLWSMWGDATGEYARYGRHLAALIDKQALRPVETLLVAGCGGGKTVLNLKNKFQTAGLDISPVMLDLARTLNPECEFIEGDMRSFRLGRTFDAVFIDDAISHINSREDFRAVFRTAFDHLNPGGVLLVTPDVTTETFQQNRTTVSHADGKNKPDHIDVTFIENHYDPDPDDHQFEAVIIYLIRENGVLRIETDHWILGLFSSEEWRRTLRETGFIIREGTYSEGPDEYTVFTCIKPGPAG